MATKALYDLVLNLTANSAELAKGLKEANSKIDGFQSSVGNAMNIAKTAFTKVLPALAAVGGAIKGVEQVMKSTEGTSDQLEFATATLQGAYSGLLKTIATGDWGGLIFNIKATATATRELKIALDDLEDISAANKLKKSILGQSLAATKLAIAEAKDPKVKAVLLSEAIETQRQISQIEIDETQKRLTAQLDFYRTSMGMGDNYFKYFTENLTRVVANWELVNSAEWKEIQTKRLAELEFKKKWYTGSKFYTQAMEFERVELHNVLQVIKDVNVAMNEGPEGKWNTEIVPLLAAVRDANSSADLSVKNLTKSLTTQETKIEKTTEAVNEHRIALEKLNDKYKEPIPGPKSIYAQPTTPFSYGDTFKRLNNTKLLADLAQPAKEFETNWVDAINAVSDAMTTFERIILQIKESGKVTFSEIFKIMSSIVNSMANVARFSNPNDKNAGSGLAGLASIIGIIGSIGAIFGFAGGTNHSPSGWSLVGERGPELVNLPGGSSVYTNLQTRSMLSGGQVVFEIDGTRLVGVLNNYNRKISNYA